MPPRQKRKAATLEEDHASKHTHKTKTQQSIHTFGSIGKPNEGNESSKKQKRTHSRDATPPPVPTSISPVKSDKKRKRQLDVVEEEEEERSSTLSEDLATSDDRRRIAATPRNKRLKNVVPQTPAETPTKGAWALFDKLRIDEHARAIPCALPKRPSQFDTPPATPKEESPSLVLGLPAELEDFQDLYSSFLASLSLHYTHNGNTSPVNLSSLLPIFTKRWKKRDVKLDDLQRMLSIVQTDNQSFVLRDHGRAGICLTRAEPRGRALKRAASYIDENELNARFREALRAAWHEWRTTAPDRQGSAAAFIKQLPRCDIAMHESAEKAAPMFARGRQRLADLKAGQASAKEEMARGAPETNNAITGPIQASQTRGSALLDRILAKQTLLSTLPAGPTKAQLERKAALQRIEDIARVLSLITGAKERSSFSMPVITQQLQQSLRNPISREEVERCLGLIADEILPGFVKILRSGEVTGVIVSRAGNVGLEEVRRRVDRACA